MAFTSYAIMLLLYRELVLCCFWTEAHVLSAEYFCRVEYADIIAARPGCGLITDCEAGKAHRWVV